ncbi:PucR family transcriptional regulator [Halalkalibacter kiskunsagensis]|uniref:PucR family transcriptional regulator n=1 Tax=Halalkalibacter kiskunsagensis TaxID=1548599 RepID=A0ABV6KBD2_9BACI
MLEKLKDHFGEEFIVNQENFSPDTKYYWFKTPEDDTVGFPTDQLQEEELALLNIFLTPLTNKASFKPKSIEETFWSTLLFDNGQVPTSGLDQYKNTSFRFVHFHLKDDTSEREAFNGAIKSLFPSKTVIIWETETNGLIIDLEPHVTDSIDNLYESIVDTIISDFYFELSMYVGLSNVVISEAHSRYRWENSCFSIVRQFTKKKIYRDEELIPYLLLHESSPVTLKQITEETLKNVINDRDLIKSIKVYLDCNMNVSLAAKKLYLHRNTLQYRVDKFIEKTGIDIKHFGNAVSIYLALMIEGLKK